MGDDEILIRPDGTIDATLDPGYQAEYADYLREIGREDLIVESAEELTVEMGGPGSGPRPGHKSSWYRRGTSKRAKIIRTFEKTSRTGVRHDIVEVELEGVTGWVVEGAGWDPTSPEVAAVLLATKDFKPRKVGEVMVSFGRMPPEAPRAAVGAVDFADAAAVGADGRALLGYGDAVEIYVSNKAVWDMADKAKDVLAGPSQNVYVAESGETTMARYVIAHEMGHIAHASSPMSLRATEREVRLAQAAVLTEGNAERSQMDKGMSKYGASSWREGVAETYAAWALSRYDLDALKNRPMLHATAVAMGWGDTKP